MQLDVDQANPIRLRLGGAHSRLTITTDYDARRSTLEKADTESPDKGRSPSSGRGVQRLPLVASGIPRQVSDVAG